MQALAQILETDNDPLTRVIPNSMVIEGIDPFISFSVYIMVPFIPLLGGVFIAVRFLHKRPFRSLITTANRINWRRVFQGAGIYLAIILAFDVISLLTSPEEFIFTFDANRFLLFLPLVLFLIPMQTMTEELLFRGYIMQGLGLLMDKWGAGVLSSFLFALMHLANPELKSAPMITVFLMFMLGVFQALITLKDGTLELAMGVHAVQNMTSFLLIMPAEGFAGLQLPAIFSSKHDTYTEGTIGSLFIVMILFWIIAFKWFPRAHPDYK